MSDEIDLEVVRQIGLVSVALEAAETLANETVVSDATADLTSKIAFGRRALDVLSTKYGFQLLAPETIDDPDAVPEAEARSNRRTEVSAELELLLNHLQQAASGNIIKEDVVAICQVVLGGASFIAAAIGDLEDTTNDSLNGIIDAITEGGG